jgi:hypothetical protein
MTQYPNAKLNAEDSINLTPFPNGYRPREVEVYLGDSSEDSVYHYRNGRWFDISLQNITDESVVQILVDNRWAYIQAENKVLLDKLGGVVLPEVPNQEFLVSRISHHLQN